MYLFDDNGHMDCHGSSRLSYSWRVVTVIGAVVVAVMQNVNMLFVSWRDMFIPVQASFPLHLNSSVMTPH